MTSRTNEMTQVDTDSDGGVDKGEFAKYFLNEWHGGMQFMPDDEYLETIQLFLKATLCTCSLGR